MLAGAAAAVVTLLVRDVPDLVHDLGGSSFPAAGVAAASLILLAIAGWVLTVVGLTVGGVSTRVVRAVTPGALRSVVFAGAAGALALSPAHAGVGPADDRGAPVSDHSLSDHSLSGLRLPDRPHAAAPSVDPSAAPSVDPSGADPAAHPAQEVVVRPGDTLWSIAAESLPAGASDADIARAGAAWHRANRDVIGPDADLILPLQRLTPPTAKDQP